MALQLAITLVFLIHQMVVLVWSFLFGHSCLVALALDNVVLVALVLDSLVLLISHLSSQSFRSLG